MTWKFTQAIKPLLNGGVIYHCGPVVAGLDTKPVPLRGSRADHQHP